MITGAVIFLGGFLVAKFEADVIAWVKKTIKKIFTKKVAE